MPQPCCTCAVHVLYMCCTCAVHVHCTHCTYMYVSLPSSMAMGLEKAAPSDFSQRTAEEEEQVVSSRQGTGQEDSTRGAYSHVKRQFTYEYTFYTCTCQTCILTLSSPSSTTLWEIQYASNVTVSGTCMLAFYELRDTCIVGKTIQYAYRDQLKYWVDEDTLQVPWENTYMSIK